VRVPPSLNSCRTGRGREPIGFNFESSRLGSGTGASRLRARVREVARWNA
jgi:hypothetical protein